MGGERRPSFGASPRWGRAWPHLNDDETTRRRFVRCGCGSGGGDEVKGRDDRGRMDHPRFQWTYRELHPDLQYAELTSSCWTIGPLSVDRGGIEPPSPACDTGVVPLDQQPHHRPHPLRHRSSAECSRKKSTTGLRADKLGAPKGRRSISPNYRGRTPAQAHISLLYLPFNQVIVSSPRSAARAPPGTVPVPGVGPFRRQGADVAGQRGILVAGARGGQRRTLVGRRKSGDFGSRLTPSIFSLSTSPFFGSGGIHAWAFPPVGSRPSCQL